eukprot:13485126-Heterocapsa_arctica.AAC.1
MVDELERYWDDVNGGELRLELVRKARGDELIEVDNREVYTKVPLAQCWEETGKAPISRRWIDTNKGDDASPEYRS